MRHYTRYQPYDIAESYKRTQAITSTFASLPDDDELRAITKRIQRKVYRLSEGGAVELIGKLGMYLAENGGVKCR